MRRIWAAVRPLPFPERPGSARGRSMSWGEQERNPMRPRHLAQKRPLTPKKAGFTNDFVRIAAGARQSVWRKRNRHRGLSGMRQRPRLVTMGTIARRRVAPGPDVPGRLGPVGYDDETDWTLDGTKALRNIGCGPSGSTAAPVDADLLHCVGRSDCAPPLKTSNNRRELDACLSLPIHRPPASSHRSPGSFFR